MPESSRHRLTVSDLVTGYVTAHDPVRRLIGLRTSDQTAVSVRYSPEVYAEHLRNLGEPARAATSDLGALLVPGRHLFAYGILDLPDGEFEAHRLVVSGEAGGDFPFERPQWWPAQVRELARFYRRAQFGDGPVDMRDYRTVLRLGGDKADSFLQETDTLSRLIYGMSTAFLLTGEEDLLSVAEAGTAYLREHMRFVDRDHDVVYWYHGIDVRDGTEVKLFTSEFGDDYAAIPAYEQIYALVGLTQTYRLTGDPAILADIEATLRLIRRFFHDPEHGGWFSHLDPFDLSPDHESLRHNRMRKNWNSIGDHAPAYLINLYLATGRPEYADMLVESADLIVSRFAEPGSPFVQERFHADWTPDRAWGWQQDRAVVGHNLKIAWNLMRLSALRPDPAYRRLAERIGRSMPGLGADLRRGGWYDVLDRTPSDSGRHRFTWHDRKAWWQQEQGILAYLILAGHTGDAEYLRQARESAAFYNAFFLDHDEGGVYFNVLANGLPYLLGDERLKGSHSMSMYHATELGLLATVYQRLLIRREPMDLWFRPRPDGFADRRLRVAPDLLPPGRVRLAAVEVDGHPYHDFDPATMHVTLPRSATDLVVRARLVGVE
ncbi:MULTISPECIES: AGE family epimerase/isomerase [Catenuloplanes]|uniref:Mannose/cellobiose epimerase-like protein (N-acyl-D-glucosamine 2-epimerase family) n=1 Tax=Catenuloplanes niger TaxID=587534 RepID=A0AAE3ZX77_9ACTN|nr:AGE family epimerase/isomerase [Catenuloplanes niger]MDR7327562.1 mannose/cellobiose epimerase-like protein (N-acyl-D-glucosamine 2-epimerase family) [Catenuloplanes niger]